MPIRNLEGWLTARLQWATVDAHRRRRGERGAPQRPRLPAWLVRELGDDSWLQELARAMLDWVGNAAPAGTDVWPLAAWVDRRAAVTGDHNAGNSVVAADVARVLEAMRRRRPVWLERNVEQPLRRKQAPVWLAAGSSADPAAEPQPLPLVARHDVEDALLRELTATAIEALRQRTDRGDDLDSAIADVLNIVFGAMPDTHDLDAVPGADTGGPEQVIALINDPARLKRIKATVLELLGRRAPIAGPETG